MRLTRFLPLMLAAALQVMPLLRAPLWMQAQGLAPCSWAFVLKLGAGAVALLGSYLAVSGATAIVAPYTVNATVGQTYIRQLGTSVQAAHSWSANTAPLHTAVYPLMPGLNLTNLTGKIGGVPTQAGTTNITITAWEKNDNSATLTVNGAPAIISQPPDQNVALGGCATFSVTAGGAAALRYQWRKEGVVLEGKTNATWTVTGVEAADAARYSVVIANSLGSVTSNDAFLRLAFGTVTNQAPIFAFTKVWKFGESGLDLGIAWREFDFDDASWPAGRGILAKEDSGNPAVFPLIGTTLSLTSPNGFVTNFYFRTHFTITNKAQVSGITFSNVFDDGAVVYLNGAEIFRTANMPPRPADRDNVGHGSRAGR